MDKRIRLLYIIVTGLVLIIIGIVVGFISFVSTKDAGSATTPGTCLPIEKGGTGCDSNAVQELISPLPIENGGTGATTVEGALSSLGAVSAETKQLGSFTSSTTFTSRVLSESMTNFQWLLIRWVGYDNAAHLYVPVNVFALSTTLAWYSTIPGNETNYSSAARYVNSTTVSVRGGSNINAVTIYGIGRVN